MGNINTYLHWRGDLNLIEHPFCEVDNLALAIFSYLDLDGIVTAEKKKVSIRQAYDLYIQGKHGNYMGDDACRILFQAMAASRRFGKAELSQYRTVFDENRTTQFAAVQIYLEDGSCYISFRGTDNSIIGWQEDFNMGSEVVPAQREAVRYLNEVVEPGRLYRIGGHSKGGNLALYSALHCGEEVASAIVAVYNNDGPGLSADIVSPERLQKIDGRLHWIIPEYSVIGTLFPYGAPSKIVSSTAEGLLQHNPFSWEIEGDTFCEKEGLSESCQFYVDIFDTWINSADLEHRRAFTRDFFGALRAGGARTINEVLGSGIDGFGTILLSIISSESRTKIVIGNFLKSFWTHCRQIDVRAAFHSKSALQGGLLLATGLLLMLFPGAALRLAGTVAGGAVIFIMGRRILTYAVNLEMEMRQKKFRILTCLACMMTVEFLIVNKSAVLVSSHFILGVFLLLFAFRTIYNAAKSGCSTPKRLFMCAAAVLSILLGLVAFTKGDEEGAIVFTLGTFLVAYGVILLIQTIYRTGAAQRRNYPYEF